MTKPDYYTDDVAEIGESFVILHKKILLEPKKTTTSGEHPKLRDDANCGYPERASCDHGEFYNRCPFMKFGRGVGGGWRCHFIKKKEVAND